MGVAKDLGACLLAVLAAENSENVYTSLLRNDLARLRPGACDSLDWKVPGGSRVIAADFEVRAHAAWRFGRVFRQQGYG